MTIGILKEHSPETRVALTPDAVLQVSERRVALMIEPGAGLGSYFSDDDYRNSGARLAIRQEILDTADCIFTVSTLVPEDIQGWNPGGILVGGLDPYNSKPLMEKLASRNITSFSLELLPRTSLAQSMDIITSMATISGYAAVLDAAIHLPHFFPMFMSAAGTIKPAKVLVLGAGVAGLQAIATARRLGAVVEVFDVRSAVRDEVLSLGGKFIEVEGSREDLSAGGYAIDQSDEFLRKQRILIHEHALKCDVVICTAQIPGKKAPLLLHSDTLAGMKRGSVIVDLAASSGGNCELTRNNEVSDFNGITVIGRSDYPRSMPMDASSMFSNNILSFFRLIVDVDGNLNLNWKDEIIYSSCVTHGGKIINDRINQYFYK
jgi:H+-translocating NAD(P) transhydrogenase subunit alpha